MFIRLSEAQHGLLLLHCCGNLLPDEFPTTRTDLTHKIWDTLQELSTWHFNVKFQLILVFRILYTSSNMSFCNVTYTLLLAQFLFVTNLSLYLR